MHPILFRIHGFTLYTYGLCVAAGAILGMVYIRSQAHRMRLSVKQVYDLVFYLMVGGLAGGRLLYVLFNASEFTNILRVFMIWEGGLMFYGGVIGMGVVCLVIFNRWHVPILNGFDTIAPAAALAHAIGRIGCFFAGCCYGAPTALPWAIRFTDPNTLAPLGEFLHPTQLYAAIGNICIFGILHYRLLHKRFDGQVFFLYLTASGLFRFLMEFLRNDPRGPSIGGLTVLQYFSAVLCVAGLIGSLRGVARRSRE